MQQQNIGLGAALREQLAQAGKIVVVDAVVPPPGLLEKQRGGVFALAGALERVQALSLIHILLLSAAPAGYYLDRSFEKLPVAGMLRTGENEIILAREFRNPDRVYEVKNDPTIHEAEANRVTVETELESIYLLGNFRVESEGKVIEKERRAFSVAGDFTVARPHADAVIENLAVDGYPFFAGSITLEKAFELTPEDLKPGCRIIVSFTRPDAVVTKVAVNGAAPSVFLWAPYEADITAQAHAGKNTLAVTLTNS